jgi:hypothetical protein
LRSAERMRAGFGPTTVDAATTKRAYRPHLQRSVYVLAHTWIDCTRTHKYILQTDLALWTSDFTEIMESRSRRR